MSDQQDMFIIQQPCRSCGATVVWVETSSGRNMPCDPDLLTVVTPAGEVVRGRVSHFATCPNADEHRRGR